MDKFDSHILEILQSDCALPVNDIADRVGLSATACWRRIQKLEEQGIVRARVALLDGARLNVGVTVFVAIRTSKHDAKWLEQFHAAVSTIPEVLELYRMSGDTDYLMRVVVPDVAAYDRIYKRLIHMAELSDVSSSFAMEQIKYTTALPLGYIANTPRQI
ncbi:MAG: transcriptional regulator [Pusillimonas sp.]|nr:transcriptional regulator [Pusillimonas sp.]MBC41591.1 transcriptional regulator [Pusillimonas sp.]HCP79447.1 transcriptional regulator [Pusillimonas sp.]|tara:strand:- start:65 stop:544 length:480 start_codon:yes stop_codon:yes gene_type:complete